MQPGKNDIQDMDWCCALITGIRVSIAYQGNVRNTGNWGRIPWATYLVGFLVMVRSFHFLPIIDGNHSIARVGVALYGRTFCSAYTRPSSIQPTH
jgi:hypothetical protein